MMLRPIAFLIKMVVDLFSPLHFRLCDGVYIIECALKSITRWCRIWIEVRLSGLRSKDEYPPFKTISDGISAYTCVKTGCTTWI